MAAGSAPMAGGELTGIARAHRGLLFNDNYECQKCLGFNLRDLILCLAVEAVV